MKKNQFNRPLISKFPKTQTEPWKSERKWNDPRGKRLIVWMHSGGGRSALSGHSTAFDRRPVSVDSSRMMKYSINVFVRITKTRFIHGDYPIIGSSYSWMLCVLWKNDTTAALHKAKDERTWIIIQYYSKTWIHASVLVYTNIQEFKKPVVGLSVCRMSHKDDFVLFKCIQI